MVSKEYLVVEVAQVLTGIYSISSLIIVLFYFPQLVLVVRAKTNLSEISLASWGVWALCIFNTFLYGYFVLGDNILAFFSLAGSACCIAIFLITVFKRKKYAQIVSVINLEDSFTTNKKESI